MLRALITAGTVQPKPIIIGMKARPLRPSLRSGLSMRNAARAMYPLSSRMDRSKNSSRIVGRNESTLPTPLSAPSTRRLRTQPATPQSASAAPSASTPCCTSAANPSASHVPNGPKVM